MQQAGVAIVGAGIVGLAHAWSAAERGHTVMLFDRDRRAQGASVRNFGMVWPIGQKAGPALDCALTSRRRWLEAAREAGLWHDARGSIYLLTRGDELAVCEEFFETARDAGYDVELLNARQAGERSPAARPDRVIGGLFSATELCVSPRQAIAKLPHWLAERYGVVLHLGTTIREIDNGTLTASDGRRFGAERIVVCGGDDFRTLFPDVFASSGIRRCKLQMMRTVPQPARWSIGPMIASGLTLRHYAAFEACGALAALRQRIAAETPELDQYGIHVMASQHPDGHVVLGDSHEYGDAIEPFDKRAIDELILRELRKVIELPDWTIEQRWHGTYGKLADRECFIAQPRPGVFVFTATGGAGMTMSFGLAERFWSGGDAAIAHDTTDAAVHPVAAG
jgi:FAD dependent oxidoreductase TIGR03364